MTLLADIRQILRDRPSSAVFVIGTGVPLGALRGTSCQTFATWDGLLRSGLHRARELGKLTDNEAADYERQLGHSRAGALLGVAAVVEQELGAPNGGEFRRWLRETVGTFEHCLVDRSVLDALAEHQRRGALLATTNYDLLLEDVTRLPSVTWRDPAGVERALRGEEPQILHLHGAWRWPESIVLGHRSYEDVARDQHAQTVLASLRAERTFIFVGCGAGLRDPNLGAFLRWTASVFSRSEYRHFRLCLESEVEELRREHVDEQRIFPLPYGAAHGDLAPFLRSLLPGEATTNVLHSVHAVSAGSPRERASEPPLPQRLLRNEGSQAQIDPGRSQIRPLALGLILAGLITGGFLYGVLTNHDADTSSGPEKPNEISSSPGAVSVGNLRVIASDARHPTPAVPSKNLCPDVPPAFYYPFDSTNLDAVGMEIVDALAKCLSSNDAKIVLEAHADSSEGQKQGGAEYCVMLTDKRGSVIGEYLAYRGVDPSRVSVVSKGGTKGNDEASKAKNRRVSIVYQ